MVRINKNFIDDRYHLMLIPTQLKSRGIFFEQISSFSHTYNLLVTTKNDLKNIGKNI